MRCDVGSLEKGEGCLLGLSKGGVDCLSACIAKVVRDHGCSEPKCHSSGDFDAWSEKSLYLPRDLLGRVHEKDHSLKKGDQWGRRVQQRRGVVADVDTNGECNSEYLRWRGQSSGPRSKVGTTSKQNKKPEKSRCQVRTTNSASKYYHAIFGIENHLTITRL